ncbi:MAG: class I SAM-dependent RNA methyltransferase [Paracoccus sp. (in: a-proteobacteria)]|nr:class I SAM-dependent RNA methyltransferase [Paracoccus sp. (in: a-proteobacteria)]
MSFMVERLGRKGDGVARAEDGRAVLAERVLPGEVIDGKPVAGRIAQPRILHPAPERVAPRCPHYAGCGGCNLMHASDEFVAGWKIDQVGAALAAQGIKARPAGIATSPERSRRRAVFAGRRTKGGALVGFHARGSDVIVDITDCRVIRPALQDLLPALRRIVVAGASRAGKLAITATETPAGADVAVRGGKPISAELMQKLTGIAAETGIARLSWEGEVITLRPPELMLGGAAVTPPPGAFLQATAEGEAALRAAVLRIVAGARHVVDLFAGCGTFTLPIAAHAEVHAVEGLAAPLAALDAACRRTPRLRRISTETRDLAARPLLVDELARYDAIVIDPPRSGAEAQAAQIAASDVPRVAWVSCDPVSFARDCRILLAGGYRLAALYAVDQFRFSPHIETVAAFTRN